MSLIRRNTGLFPSILNDVFTPDWFGGVDSYNQRVPAVNIREGEKEFTLELAVPGQKKEDFNVEVDNDVMTISMETKDETSEKDGEYTRREFNYEAFERSLMLPESVKEEKIKAKYNDGILKFKVMKKEEAKKRPPKVIEVG